MKNLITCKIRENIFYIITFINIIMFLIIYNELSKIKIMKDTGFTSCGCYYEMQETKENYIEYCKKMLKEITKNVNYESK